MEQDYGVGREVKRLREAREWSQSRLAVEADMSVSGVSMIENGHRNLSTATLAKLAQALGVEVGDLFPKAQAPLPLDVSLMARPGVQEWLQAQGHMTDEEFLDYVDGLDLAVDEGGFPRGIERAIGEMRRRRDGIREALKNPGAQEQLFGRSQTEGLTGDDRIRELFRPHKEARSLADRIRREYARREAALVGYSVGLFVQGVTDDYLRYDLSDQYRDHRHEDLLKERALVLEEGSNLAPTEGVRRHWLEVAYKEAETA